MGNLFFHVYLFVCKLSMIPYLTHGATNPWFCRFLAALPLKLRDIKNKKYARPKFYIGKISRSQLSPVLRYATPKFGQTYIQTEIMRYLTQHQVFRTPVWNRSNGLLKFPQNTKNGITRQILIHFHNLKSKNAVNFKLYLSVIKSISQLLSMIQKKWNLIFDYTRQ